ncbi:C6 transcription factor [Aspergillus bombycis]|uniref:C6 transcription factor n=1 Tax=Aspergillus bombycis TaxID=109264 RepID=A0A1F8A9L5_9EURO|nr:C6 transcription factor [Aspergillus bombycis]OGM47988.1 C6 transcription factor [Aspergillus bombycis]
MPPSNQARAPVGRGKTYKRGYVACVSCRARKVRCILGDEPPCAKCEREHRECVFETSRKVGKHRQAPRWSLSQNYVPESSHGQSVQERPSDTCQQDANRTPRVISSTGSEPDPLQVTDSDTHGNPSLSGRVMATILARPRDALDVLFDAARPDVGESPSSQTREQGGPARSKTQMAVSASGLVSVSGLSHPSESVLDLWDRCRFVRQGWFTAQEAVTYLDLFYKYLAPLSPVPTVAYYDHKNHEQLIVEEPMLCCTILMIASRYFVLPGAGGISRSHFIHHRLWQYCELLIRRIMFGQEKYSTAKTRIVGSIESLILISDWNPRSVHFPPETEGWDGELISPAYDRRNRLQTSEDVPLIRWREDVFEPAKRSERMSWMLLGAAVTLGYELGVFADGYSNTPLLANSQHVRVYRARKLLYTYVTQMAVRMGCPSPILDNVLFAPDPSQDNITEHKNRQWEVYMKSWTELTRLMKTASAMFFQSISYVKQQLSSGRYSTLLQHFAPSLAQWHDEFKKSTDTPKVLGPLLLIEYHHLRAYTSALAIQAVVERAVVRGVSWIGDTSRESLDGCVLPHDQDFIRDVILSSSKVLQIATEMAIDGMLRYAPLRTLVCVTSSSVYLLKAISLGAHHTDLHASLHTLDECISALRSSGTDDMDFSLRYASLIEKHVDRFRANFISERVATMNPDHRRYHLQTPEPLTSTQSREQPHMHNATSNYSGQQPTDAFVTPQMDSWWAQPFDPNIAPFNFNGEGVSIGLELDSLDFLLNLPQTQDIPVTIPSSRGKIPSLQASRLRSMVLEAHNDPNKIVAHVCSYDALSSKLCEEAGFPIVFLAGYAMASAFALPDTGYIAFQEVAAKVQEVVRATSVPVLVDGDTGYGGPMNVRRTVEGFARAGAAGIMIEDQTWPKRCGHTKGKAVVSRSEAYARWRAAVDARNEGLDIWIMARTDSLIHGYDEALARAREAIKIGVDCVFVEALPDRETMLRLRKDLDFPVFANIIEGGKTENLSAKDLAELGYSAVAYPWTLVAAKLKSIRETLEAIKGSFMVGKPPTVLSYEEVCEGVGFNRYYEMEEKYQYDGSATGSNGYQWA